jgi:DNA-directed RNA polymerase sigma subunit (sigma70/sigma32)
MANDRSAMSDFMRSLYGIEPLPKEEEFALSKRIQAGDEHALDKLVRHNIRFVVSVLKKTSMWHHGKVDIDDLVGFGCEQLLIAARKWVPKNNARFATYAKPFILRGVERHVLNTSHIIRISRNVLEEIRKMNYTERVLTQELGRTPKMSELATKLDKPQRRVHQLKGYLLREPTSLDVLNAEHFTDDIEE